MDCEIPKYDEVPVQTPEEFLRGDNFNFLGKLLHFQEKQFSL